MPLSEDYIFGKNSILKNYIQTCGMANIQLSSYESCLKELDKIVREETYESETADGLVTIIKFKNLSVENPTVIEDNRIKKKSPLMKLGSARMIIGGIYRLISSLLNLKINVSLNINFILNILYVNFPL